MDWREILSILIVSLCLLYAVKITWEYQKENKLETKDTIMAYVVSGAILFGILGTAFYFINFLSSFSYSENSTEWSNFGSFISGAFAPASGLALLVTIYVFEKQFKEQRSINKDQLRINELQYNALLSDQYDRHRNWFCQKLEELESFYNKKIEIHSKTELYGRLFPDNRPDKPLEKRVLDLESEHYRYELEGIIEAIEGLKKEDETKKIAPLDSQVFDVSVLSSIDDIFSQLNINYVGELESGLVLYNNEKTCINILEVDLALSMLAKIVNTILDFSEVKKKIKFSGEVNSHLIRDKMIKDFKRKEKRDQAFKIYATENFLKIRDAYLISSNPKNRPELNCLYTKTAIYMAERNCRTEQMERDINDLIDQKIKDKKIDIEKRELLKLCILNF